MGPGRGPSGRPVGEAAVGSGSSSSTSSRTGLLCARGPCIQAQGVGLGMWALGGCAQSQGVWVPQDQQLRGGCRQGDSVPALERGAGASAGIPRSCGCCPCVFAKALLPAALPGRGDAAPFWLRKWFASFVPAARGHLKFRFAGRKSACALFSPQNRNQSGIDPETRLPARPPPRRLRLPSGLPGKELGRGVRNGSLGAGGSVRPGSFSSLCF